MARKRGPVGRVRNIRNNDPSTIPLPYPKLCVVKAIHTSTYEVVINLFDAETGLAVIDAGRDWDWLGDVRYELNGAVATLERVSVPGIPLQFLIFTSFDPENDTLIIVPWSSGWRGLNGEWIAPLQAFIGPVV